VISLGIFLPLLKIGPITVRNRIAVTAHVTMFGENHLPTERMAYYLTEKAKGGAGLIIGELTSVHPTSSGRPALLGAFEERATLDLD
jgi:2,4-dienoyl-CoA reductase-like NADH-dependent reductase (Old Yellow Enzyme family)